MIYFIFLNILSNIIKYKFITYKFNINNLYLRKYKLIIYKCKRKLKYNFKYLYLIYVK